MFISRFFIDLGDSAAPKDPPVARVMNEGEDRNDTTGLGRHSETFEAQAIQLHAYSNGLMVKDKESGGEIKATGRNTTPPNNAVVVRSDIAALDVEGTENDRLISEEEDTTNGPISRNTV